MIIFASAALVRQRCGAWHERAPARDLIPPPSSPPPAAWGQHRRGVQTLASSHATSSGLDQTWPITSQKFKKGKEKTWGEDRGLGGKKNTKIWTRSLFKHFNPFVLMVPGASVAGTGPAPGKPDSPSQRAEEKAANHLNRNWNLFTCGLFPITRGTPRRSETHS